MNNVGKSHFHGPQLPSNFKKVSDESSSNGEESTEEFTDEPRLTSCSTSGYFGPALPPNFKTVGNDEGNFGNSIKAQKETSLTKVIIGPSLPPALVKTDITSKCEEDFDDMCGPLLPGSEEEKRSQVHGLLEMQARAIQKRLAEKKLEGDADKTASRETWMLELPAASSASLGLGPRMFKKKEGPDMSDRSSWTDTPEDKRRKEQLSQMGVQHEPMNHEEETRKRALDAKESRMEEEMKKLKKKRDKSLLEEHEKKLRKQRKKDKKKRKGKPEERRPFSREVDLQVNRFDEAKRKAVIKKANLLNTRFSSGESKFL